MKKVLTILGNSVKSIFQGKFLLRLKADRYLPQIVFVFFMFTAAIWISLLTERSMRRVEEGKETINNLRTIYSMRVLELERFNDKVKMTELLEKCGSSLEEPVKVTMEQD